MLVDNKGTLALAENTEFLTRTKHIHAQECFITDLVENRQCLLEYIRTHDMVTDTMTKALPREAHHQHGLTMNMLFGHLTPNKCYLYNIVHETQNQLHAHLLAVQHYVEEHLSTIGDILSSTEF